MESEQSFDTGKELNWWSGVECITLNCKGWGFEFDSGVVMVE